MNKAKRFTFFIFFVMILILTTGCPNKPPRTPEINGPTVVGVGAQAEYKAVSTDPNKDDIRYFFDWEVKMETTNYYKSGDTAKRSFTWTTPDTYDVRARAQDKKGKLSPWSNVLKVRVISNTKPNAPTAITGPSSGLKDSSYTFSTSSTDPDGDSVRIFFIWGDGKVDTTPFVTSGTPVSSSHAYSDTGVFNIKAVAQDNKFALSDTSSPKTFTVRSAHNPGEILWTFQGEDDFVSSPALIMEGGLPVIYIGCKDGRVYKLNGKTGAKMAEFASPILGDEFNSSPAIGPDGTVYIGSEEGYLFALTSNLTFKWKWPDDALRTPFASSPALTADGKIIIGNDNDTLYAIRDAGTQGQLVWKYPARSGIFASPAIDGGGYIYFADQSDSGFVYKLDPNGNFQWSVASGGEVYSSPAIDGNGNIFIPSASGKICALTPTGSFLSGWPVFVPESAEIHSSVVFEPDSGFIILGHEEKGILFYRRNGTLMRHLLSPLEGVFATPIVAQGNIVYFLTNEGKFVGYDYKENDEIFLIDLATKGGKKLQEEIYTSPTIAPDGTIFVAYEGKVYGIYGNKSLSASPWPKFRQGLKNTGRAGGGKI